MHTLVLIAIIVVVMILILWSGFSPRSTVNDVVYTTSGWAVPFFRPKRAVEKPADVVDPLNDAATSGARPNPVLAYGWKPGMGDQLYVMRAAEPSHDSADLREISVESNVASPTYDRLVVASKTNCNTPYDLGAHDMKFLRGD